METDWPEISRQALNGAISLSAQIIVAFVSYRLGMRAAERKEQLEEELSQKEEEEKKAESIRNELLDGVSEFALKKNLKRLERARNIFLFICLLSSYSALFSILVSDSLGQLMNEAARLVFVEYSIVLAFAFIVAIAAFIFSKRK